MQDAISRSREIVYGDDFTLMCMLDSIETHHFITWFLHMLVPLRSHA